MSFDWISIVMVLGWLVLALSALRAHRVGARKAVTMALVWGAIFVAVAGFFTAIRH